MHHLRTLGILIFAVCLTQVASDIYAPSLPFISTSFNTTAQYAQWTMAIYMMSVACSQLIYGPLSERYGRKAPILFGLVIMCLGSWICFLSSSIEILFVGRMIQGIGAGACAALWRTIFRDYFQGDDLSRYGSYLMILVMFIVPAAPVFGGILQDHLGWRSSFAFMVLYAFLSIFLFAFYFKDTLPENKRVSLNLPKIGSIYRHLLKSPDFMCGSLCVFLCYGAFFSWFTAGPILMIEKSGMTPTQFGWFTFLGCGTAYAIAGLVNARMVKKYGPTAMLKLGWMIMMIASVILYVGHILWGINAFAIGAPIIVFYFGSTFIWPNTYAMAFTPFGSIAGYVGALYGFMQLAGAGCLAYLVSFLKTTDQRPMALTMTGSVILAVLVFHYYANMKKKNGETYAKIF
ncbi:MAG: multidrug effflux MFS transporter [Candidatus Nucleicultricaceae bacterium]